MDPEDTPTEQPEEQAPKRTLTTSRAETQASGGAIGVATRRLLCIHFDLSISDLSRTEVVDLLAKFLLAHRSARARLLVDDATSASYRAPPGYVRCSSASRWCWKCASPRWTIRWATMPR